LKEKVSITAATVVGFLIAGTVAFGAATDVEFKTADNSGESKVMVTINSDTTDIKGATNSISVADYEKLTTAGGKLAGLLTIETVDGVTTFASAVNEKGEATLGTVKATATTNGALTLIKTDKTYKSIVSSLEIEASGNSSEKTATAMEAANSGDKVTNAGTIAVKDYAVGMVAGAGATAVNDTNSEITVEGEDSSVGMSATTVTKSTTTLTNNGKITVTKGTGISVAGAGEAEVTAGEIEVAGEVNNIGINIADGTEKTTVTGAKITLAGAGKGINAEGNVTLKDIAITLSEAATGTGIKYDGKTTKATAEISTGNIDIKAAGTGIDATMSKVAKSTLNITTGIISTENAGATGIKIAGTELRELSDGETPTTATVTTTLGATAGTGVEVAGAKNNTINVTLQDTQTPTSKTPISIAKGIDVTSNGDKGIINIDVKQSNLQVAKSGNLVNIGDVGGTTNVDINQNVELVGTGNLVNVGAITGTTNVDINKDVKLTGTGNIVTAGNLGEGGTLNINLNVEGNTGLNVKEENTALNLASVDKDNKAFVKNTGTVTIEGNGTLVKGNDTNTISLSNQGLIKVNVIDTATSTNSSHISSGTKVNVANYGTIDLSSSGITVAKFIEKAGVEGKTLDQLTIEEVKTALKTLGVIADKSEGTFSSVGYIRFKNGELFTTAKALTGEQTVEGLSSALNQEDSDRAFAIA
ncbi:beta strand repeat-containing protein, partial [Fusobacterium varium]|uniref:beta strand repeat-containing protein n=1 Tax=Fusobacterium varium TaxID=856 RepID=UPI00399D1A82|nr:autotransporter domain-containing protein [Fusobacterium varium]